MSKAIRPTRHEHAERINLAMKCIGAGMHDGDIKRAVANKYGISPRSVERYIKAAREMLLARRQRSRAELQAESMAFYEQVLRNPDASQRDRIFARKRIDELLGLDEPRRLEHTATDGVATPVRVIIGEPRAGQDQPHA